MLWRGSSVLFASTCATKQVSLPFPPYIEDEWTTLESRFVPLKDAIVYGSYTTKNHTVGNSRERAMNRSRARSMGKVHPLDSLFLCLNIRNLPQISQSCTESCARATYVRQIAHHHQPLKSIFTCTITVRRNSAPLAAFVLIFFLMIPCC